MDSDYLSPSPQLSRQVLFSSGSTLNTPNAPSFMKIWPMKCPEGTSGMRLDIPNAPDESLGIWAHKMPLWDETKSQDTLRGCILCPTSANKPQVFPNPFEMDDQSGKQEQGKGASCRLQL